MSTNNRRGFLSALGVGAFIALLPLRTRTKPMRYWLDYGSNKWGAFGERFHDGTRVLTCGYDTPEEADVALHKFVARTSPELKPWRKEAMPTRLIRQDGQPGPWIMTLVSDEVRA